MKTKTEVFQTWLPVFQGFYESGLEDDDDLEPVLFNNPDDIDDDLKKYILENIYDHIDYSAYHNALSESITEAIGDLLIEQNLITGYMFEKLSSPKYYNFSNDSINVAIEANLDQLVIRCLSRMENADDKEGSFREYIKEKYTSYDGFSSSYTNNPYLWLKEIYEDGPCDNDHKIGSMLQYLIGESEVDYYLIHEACHEVYIGEYIDYKGLTEAINDEFGETLKDFSDLEDDDKQHVIPGKIEKGFLQRLTGIGLFETVDIDISDMVDKYGLNNTSLMFVV